MVFNVETQVLEVKPQKPFKNSFPEITGRREQPPYIDFNFLASTGRRLRPPDLQATTWRKLPLPSFPASTGRRLRPPFLAPSCHPDKNIDTELLNHNRTDPVALLINTCTIRHNLYHTAHSLPLLTIDHCLLHHTAHQLITVCCITLLIIWSLFINSSLAHHCTRTKPVTCPTTLYQPIIQPSQSESVHQTLSTWIKPNAHTT